MAPSEQFASSPQAVPQREKWTPSGPANGLYRDEDINGRSTNIMNDRRVMRGNTYASLVAQSGQDEQEIQKHREAQSNRLRRANQRKQGPGTPEPLQGRKHMDIQTDTYLEELTQRTMAFEAETMTDFLTDRPPSPLFMPAKIGVDMETQIEEGDLFDFDREVECMLQVLVGKTLEVSMIEVLEEEELATMRRHQQEYEQIRTQEMLEVQRIEEQERRRSEECQRRKTQLANHEEMKKQLKNKMKSRQLARTYLASLKSRALDTLTDMGLVAKEPMSRNEVEAVFMPWLMEEAVAISSNKYRNKLLAEDLAKKAVHHARMSRARIIGIARSEIAEAENAERRIRLEEDETKRLENMEAERLAEEERARLEEARIPVEIEVIEFNPEDPDALKLEEEIEGLELSDELKEDLAQKWADKGEDRVFLAVNKVDAVGDSVRVGQPLEAAGEPAEGEAPTEEG